MTATSVWRRAWLAGLVALTAAAPAAARIAGDIENVGYRSGPSAAGSGAGVRAGAWFPIVVSLSLEGGNTFEGELRVEQRDSDGDYCYDARPVYLTADSGIQFFELYAVAGPLGAPGLAVTLHDKNGRVVPVFTSGQTATRMVPSFPVDLVDDRVPIVLHVAPAGWTASKIDALREAPRLRAPPHLIRRSPAQLPSRWIGLEIVDYVVWDNADATELTLPQRQALVEWVRQGGTLVIASAARADTLMRSDVFEPLLPVEIGKVVQTQDLPNVRRQLLRAGAERTEPGYGDGISVAQCTPRADSLVEVLLEDSLTAGEGEAGASTVLISSRGVGRGRLIFVGATLRDLLDTSGAPAFFLTRTLGLRDAPVGIDQGIPSCALFPYLQEVVGFQATGASYLALAFLLALVYLFASTFGAWAFLKSRNWPHYNWLVFAVLAIAASLLSVSAVQAVRGVGQKLHQLSIVDLSANSAEAAVSCYFGLKTGLHSEVDVWLPDEYAPGAEPGDARGYVRPMIEVTGSGGGQPSRFTNPTDYRLRPASARLEDVPVRATLKRFEGRWNGTITGGVQASIRVQRGHEVREESITGETSSVTVDLITPDSTITNNLGVDLYDCYLMQAEVDAFDPTAGYQCRSPRGQKLLSNAAFVHPLGDIRAGETIRVLDRFTRDRNGNAKPTRDWVEGDAMHNYHKTWGDPFKGTAGVLGGPQANAPQNVRRDFQKALLLLTTLDEFYPGTIDVPSWQGPGLELLPDRCRELDLSDRLTRHAMILVGFADDAGPVKLCTRTGNGNYERLIPNEAWTMYRVIIPVP